MKVCILFASPRPQGNTASLLTPFEAELKARGAECRRIDLYRKKILPCLACRACQKDWTKVGCIQSDDMQEVFDAVLACDVLVLASPIYSWYCTPPLKAALDRLVYGMNKYYGEERGPSLWRGKQVAIVTSCGYAPEKGADLWEEGVRRYCKHSQLRYIGMLCERHLGYNTVFMDEDKARRAREFAGAIDAAGLKRGE
jgi:multimeric flavodoxin WrbA